MYPTACDDSTGLSYIYIYSDKKKHTQQVQTSTSTPCCYFLLPHKERPRLFKHTINIRGKHCDLSRVCQVYNHTPLSIASRHCKDCRHFMYFTVSSISAPFQHQCLLRRYLYLTMGCCQHFAVDSSIVKPFNSKLFPA